MKTENDFTKTNDNGEVKTSKWGYVLAVIIIALITLFFVPIKKKRTYSNITQVTLIDMVLVQFEWTAHYKSPLFVADYNKDRQRFERNIDMAVTNRFNQIIRAFVNSKQLLIAGQDSMQLALYCSQIVKELPVDTIIINKMQFEERFLDYIAEQKEIRTQQIMLKQRAITDSIAHLNALKRAKAQLEVAAVENKIRKLEKETVPIFKFK